MVKLRGKGVFYVVEKTLHEHAKVGTVGDLNNTLEELKITNSSKTTTLCLNINKKVAYLKDKATAIRLIFKALSINNQALYNKYTTAFTL